VKHKKPKRFGGQKSGGGGTNGERDGGGKMLCHLGVGGEKRHRGIGPQWVKNRGEKKTKKKIRQIWREKGCGGNGGGGGIGYF